ncbi:MAG: hypothetical protein K5634_00945 [Sphaerochaetaceae bacterium]|nr:hypothetical protein [Sphaerochaetaceae bacterium]
MKKILAVLLLILVSLSLYAETYNVKIRNADLVKARDKYIVLEGHVVLELTTDGSNSDKQTRTLTADRIEISSENKEIVATGNVSLSAADLRDYTGDSIVFNWDSLDLMVYNGNSSIDRKSSGTNLVFYLDGEEVSYGGGDDGPIIMSGVSLATRENDPYWSIKADNIAVLESDFVFKNALIKLGRVPVFWLPVLYYPNTRLAINPAVGISGTKGMFLNTTFEVYGRYPAIWEKSTTSTSSSSSDSSDNASSAAFSALSLLSNEEDGVMIRDGIIYRPAKDNEEYSGLQKWAQDTSSYLAVTADAYANYGLALGFDTLNNLFDKKLKLQSRGVLAYMPEPALSYYNPLRYALDVSGTYKNNKTTFTFSVPLISDPNVKTDFYNRNTDFELDTVLGNEATVPTTNKKVSKYTISASLNTSFEFLSQKFSLSTLKTELTYEWDSSDYAYSLSTEVLPELNASLSGSIFNLRKETSQEEKTTYSNDLAEEYLETYRKLNESSSTSEEEKKSLSTDYEKIRNKILLFRSSDTDAEVSTYSTSFSDTSTKSDSYGVSLDYKANGYVKREAINDTLYLKANGNINLKADSPLDIISLTETITPEYVYNKEDKETYPVSKDFKITSSLKASSDLLGLSYVQNISLYKYKFSKDVETIQSFKWEKDYFTAHSVEFSKSLTSSFSFSVKQQLKPLDLINTPSLTFKKGVFTITGSTQMYLEEDLLFKKGKANLSVIQKDSNYEFKITDTYDFSKDGWLGNTLVQSLSLSFFDSNLKLTESLTLESDFKYKSLDLGVSWKKNYVKFKFSDYQFIAEKMTVHLDYSVDPLYFWENRIGVEASFSADYDKEFSNIYGSSLKFNFGLNFEIYEFLSLQLKTTSANTSFYRYYDENENFSLPLMLQDLLKSFDFFGNGRKSTGFNLSSMSLKLVHYMYDWNLNIEAKASIASDSDGKYWSPEVKVYVQWNAIPELKSENKLVDEEWEK